jgi:redox-sensitive bicupin YhaK (pirin superfamily)
MDRKKFLRKSLLGASVLVSGAAAASVLRNDIDELKPLDPVGFDHLPPTPPERMENMVLHRASERGTADHGWLKANFSFSFANHYDPTRMHFGVLRVMNDDIIAAGKGFGTHPHDNMEIITIPLKGALQHKDSMGNTSIINAGDVQVMSAGTGILHSEFNPNADMDANTLQIWLFPRQRQVTPRYQQMTLDPQERVNKFQQVLSPNPDDAGVWIHQDAWFHIGNFDADRNASYSVKRKGNGVYAFIISGSATINGQQLGKRDALGVWDTAALDIQVGPDGAEILLQDVPMELV